MSLARLFDVVTIPSIKQVPRGCGQVFQRGMGSRAACPLTIPKTIETQNPVAK